MSKKDEIEVVNPTEFGLNEEQALKITAAFDPKTIELDGYKKVYETLLTKEITAEVCKEAGELRKKLVKVRTGYADVHKTEKAFFLAAGKFVDALKNKRTLPVEQMEEKLAEMEKHYENQEKERLEKVKNARLELLAEFEDFQPEFYDLANMDDAVFKKLLKDQQDLKDFKAEKAAREAKEAAEREQKEKEEEAKRKAEEAAEQERVKAENERLKLEAEAKAKIRTARNLELRPYIVFIRDYSGMLDMEEGAYQKEFEAIKKGAADQWAYDAEQKRIKEEADEKAEKQRQREEKAKAVEEAKLKANQEKALKEKKEAEDKAAALQKELDDKKAAEEKAAAEKKAAEEKAEADRIAEEEAKLAMGDEEKYGAMLQELQNIIESTTFESKNFKSRRLQIIGVVKVIKVVPINDKMTINIS